MEQQELLQELLGEGGAAAANPLAGLNQLTEMLPVLLAVSIVGLVIIGTFAVILTISRIRSQMATVAMQKDVRAIRDLLERQLVPTTPKPERPLEHAPQENSDSL